MDAIDEIIGKYALDTPQPTCSKADAARELLKQVDGKYTSHKSAEYAIYYRLNRKRILSTRKSQKTPQKQEPTQRPCMTEQQLRSTYDIRAVVMQALDQIKEGEYWYDGDFIRYFGLQGKSGYRPVLESKDCEKYRGKAQGKVIYGHPSSIQRMKQEGVLL